MFKPKEQNGDLSCGHYETLLGGSVCHLMDWSIRMTGQSRIIEKIRIGPVSLFTRQKSKLVTVSCHDNRILVTG